MTQPATSSTTIESSSLITTSSPSATPAPSTYFYAYRIWWTDTTYINSDDDSASMVEDPNDASVFYLDGTTLRRADTNAALYVDVPDEDETGHYAPLKFGSLEPDSTSQYMDCYVLDDLELYCRAEPWSSFAYSCNTDSSTIVYTYNYSAPQDNSVQCSAAYFRVTYVDSKELDTTTTAVSSTSSSFATSTISSTTSSTASSTFSSFATSTIPSTTSLTPSATPSIYVLRASTGQYLVANNMLMFGDTKPSGSDILVTISGTQLTGYTSGQTAYLQSNDGGHGVIEFAGSDPSGLGAIVCSHDTDSGLISCASSDGTKTSFGTCSGSFFDRDTIDLFNPSSNTAGCQALTISLVSAPMYRIGMSSTGPFAVQDDAGRLQWTTEVGEASIVYFDNGQMYAAATKQATFVEAVFSGNSGHRVFDFSTGDPTGNGGVGCGFNENTLALACRCEYMNQPFYDYMGRNCTTETDSSVNDALVLYTSANPDGCQPLSLQVIPV